MLLHLSQLLLAHTQLPVELLLSLKHHLCLIMQLSSLHRLPVLRPMWLKALQWLPVLEMKVPFICQVPACVLLLFKMLKEALPKKVYDFATDCR